MSLNTSHANGGVLIYNGERILIYHDGVEMQIDASSNMPHFKGKKKGRIYLTTHRVIFNTRDNKDTLQSFAIPFLKMRNIELEQPVFGANYIRFNCTAENGGNWEGTATVKLHFYHGGAIEFGQALLKAGSLANQYFQQSGCPGFYVCPVTGPIYQAPPPAYAPPQGPQYGFIPYQTFPDAPPAHSVYSSEAPPPYPGIEPFGGNNQNRNNKAMEAATSAYYTPSNPHNVYVPQATGPSAPPSYEEATKKYQ